ncbi:unnamed protein product [Protopolystoma xenopodis]|uniref:Uncharacterized protein n=1 Tax=Protopolystoma xenopodis TaxID=117903 RepID=A0A3S5BD96_9PLAT|nr:unnamed protein product [Protopolystoma xenopodis]
MPGSVRDTPSASLPPKDWLSALELTLISPRVPHILSHPSSPTQLSSSLSLPPPLPSPSEPPLPMKNKTRRYTLNSLTAVATAAAAARGKNERRPISSFGVTGANMDQAQMQSRCGDSMRRSFGSRSVPSGLAGLLLSDDLLFDESRSYFIYCSRD